MNRQQYLQSLAMEIAADILAGAKLRQARASLRGRRLPIDKAMAMEIVAQAGLP